MRLRSGRTYGRLPSLPVELQRLIFRGAWMDVLATADAHLARHMIEDELIADPPAALAWAVGRKNRWLVGRLVRRGVEPCEAVLAIARRTGFAHAALGTSGCALALEQLFRKGRLEEGLRLHTDGLPVSEQALSDGAYFGVLQADPGLRRYLELWPGQRRQCFDYACMNGCTGALRLILADALPGEIRCDSFAVRWVVESKCVEAAEVVLSAFPQVPLDCALFNVAGLAMVDCLLRHAEFPPGQLTLLLEQQAGHGDLHAAARLLGLGAVVTDRAVMEAAASERPELYQRLKAAGA